METKETDGRKLWREKLGNAKSVLIKRYGVNKFAEIFSRTEKVKQMQRNPRLKWYEFNDNLDIETFMQLTDK